MVYSVTALPQLEGWVGSFATAINDSGVIVGVAMDAGDPFVYRAVRWASAASTPVVLTLPGDAEDVGLFSSFARAVNASGVACGYYIRAEGMGFGNRALRWSAGGSPTALDFFEGAPGEEISDSFGINGDGVVVGFVDQDPTSESGTPQPCYWIGTTPTALALPADTEDVEFYQGTAVAINNNGVISGTTTVAPSGGAASILRWDAGVPSLLESLNNDNDYPPGINDLDQICGISYDPDSASHGVVWEGTSIVRDLDAFPGEAERGARGINDAGIVVGQADLDGLSYAALWEGTAITQLPALDGYDQGGGANDINTGGLIVGSVFSLDAEIAVIWGPAESPGQTGDDVLYEQLGVAT